MQGTFIGFNTTSIKYEERFLALMLKMKQTDQICQVYYLQAQILIDLLLALQNRMGFVLHRLNERGESYKAELIAFNEDLVTHTPPIEMSEIQQPNPERRIMNITLKPGDTWSTLILVLQNEQIATLRIDDMQVEALLIAIQQSLKSAEDQQIIDFVSSNLDFLMLYTADFTKQPSLDYQHYLQDEWKLNLFTHYLGVLFCCDTDEGKKIISGGVIKTNAPHLSEAENSVVMRIIEKSPKLKAMHEANAPCQVFSTVIPSNPGKMLTLQECLQPLHAFYIHAQKTLNA